ncbi:MULTISPECIES: hypothetical protein [unclassified Ruegeria]|uniref:hypothetical protein n=1 Tax=unclassified Ruegeria TaxID=2625375 RepID=UPI001488D4CB|nr:MULTISPECIES: hypothetical protein [unclassified Ruegeria]
MRAPIQLILALGSLAILIGMLAVGPRLLPPDPTLPNVAAMQGYNIGLAWILIFVWAVLVILLTSLPAQTHAVEAQATQRPVSLVQAWVERLVVTLPLFVFYWPSAIARFGPHIEDSYFIAALHRISCGQIPYQDFEFLYGPLMLIPAAMLIGDGFSPLGYYWIYLGLQAALLIIVMAVLQRLIPQTGKRWLVFVLLLPFWVDVLLGLNWIAWRYLPAILAIVLVAHAPRKPSMLALVAVLLGIGAGYSHEYAIAGLVAAIAILVLDGWDQPRALALRILGLIALTIVIWLLVVSWALGGTLAPYFTQTLQVMSRASAEGLGQFSFAWSLHSLALFGLLAAACVAAGSGVRRLAGTHATEGDLMLMGSGVFAVITLKIALQRADFLHLAVPFVPLILVWLAGQPTALFRVSLPLRRFGVAMIALAACAQLAGHAPLGRWVLFSNLRGLFHEVTGRDTAGAIEARGPSTQAFRTKAQPARVDLADRLAAPDLAGRPVIFYGNLWKMAAETGTCPAGYSFYDILYTDPFNPLSQTARAEGTIIVARADDLADLTAETGTEPKAQLAKSGLLPWIIGDVASQSKLENQIEFRMWQQALGADLVEDFEMFDQSGPYVLMEQKDD